MNVEVHMLDCTHPFGDGIHVLIPPDSAIMLSLTEHMKMSEEIMKDYENLKKLTAPDKAATICKAYKGVPPKGNQGECYLVLSMLVHDDMTVNYMAVFLLIDRKYKEQGRQVVSMLRASMHGHNKPNL